MDFDINTLRGLLTLALMILFGWLCVWAYSKKQLPAFNEAANLPFADENLSSESAKPQTKHDTSTVTSTVNTKTSGEPS